MAGVSIDASEVRRLADDLGKIPTRLLPEVDKVAKKGADNLKNDLNGQAAASEHFHGMAGSVSYDRAYGINSVSYEVGPDKGRRGGALGNLFFFGGANGGGGTGDIDGALSREEPRFTTALGSVLGDLL